MQLRIEIEVEFGKGSIVPMKDQTGSNTAVDLSDPLQTACGSTASALLARNSV